MCAKQTILMCAILCVALVRGVAGKSHFGIGERVIGDQLLLKDKLELRTGGLTSNPMVLFNYAIPEPITYMEIQAAENVYGEVSFSYRNNLVKGTITAFYGKATASDAKGAGDNDPDRVAVARPPKQPIQVVITIYGFNETVTNVDPAHVLNRGQMYEGQLEPTASSYDGLDDPEIDYEEEEDDDDEEGDLVEEDIGEDYDRLLEDNSPHETKAAGANAWQHVTALGDEDENDEENEDDDEFGQRDKVIEVGRRQPGDYLIYETYQTSPNSTEQPANHTVVFYYVDSDYITYAKFVIVDHFDNNNYGDEYRPALAEYSHFSPHTLKAAITDYKKTSSFVQMFLYGYKPQDRPATYKPFLDDRSSPALSRFQQLFRDEQAKQAAQKESLFDHDAAEYNGGAASMPKMPIETATSPPIVCPENRATTSGAASVAVNLSIAAAAALSCMLLSLRA